MDQSKQITIDAYQPLSEFDPIWIEHYLSQSEQDGLVSAEKIKGKQQRCARVMIKHLVFFVILAIQKCTQDPSLTLHQELNRLTPSLSFQHIPSPYMIDMIAKLSIQKDQLGAPMLLFQGKVVEELQLSMSHDENMVYVSLAFDELTIQRYFLS